MSEPREIVGGVFVNPTGGIPSPYGDGPEPDDDDGWTDDDDGEVGEVGPDGWPVGWVPMGSTEQGWPYEIPASVELPPQPFLIVDEPSTWEVTAPFDMSPEMREQLLRPEYPTRPLYLVNAREYELLRVSGYLPYLPPMAVYQPIVTEAPEPPPADRMPPRQPVKRQTPGRPGWRTPSRRVKKRNRR